ncbi:Pimeloyl-ACP methyl ester carboxylesterase [Pseudovibrio ascidiaceicola]|uniref:Pimeloyl-ACP methyl ester carboxylesterase n=1 Tax=Pseudovibrio ascidiaceicola TaxID=285279 RepID=A0A1I4BNJ8_9HYPH|nr:alpha/beta hydrolase [Pseudovibrio ascidiaceicola]SFK69767.1 Pimeloyl-ACP methyl ester carboxylesterase [Pseudovibrio ascidiaceicola]
MLQAPDYIDVDLQNVTGATRFTWKASDGLTLSAHIWEPDTPRNPTVLCLSGLTRNTRDFYQLANFLRENSHRVIAMDYRGRGLSDHSKDYETYSLDQEADDIDRGIEALGLEKFALIGTSRGGLHSFSMAQRHPERLLSVIINDIGPVIEPPALDDIIASVGTVMSQPNMKAAAERLASIHATAFPTMSETDWITFANQLYAPNSDGVSLRYDKRLGDTLRGNNKAAPENDLWQSFSALKPFPHLLLHGQNSRLLTTKTVNKMQQLHEKMKLSVIPNQGHAPLLWDQPTQTRIFNFIRQHV